MATSSRNSVLLKDEDKSNSFHPVPSHMVESYGGVMPSKVRLTTDKSEERWKISVENFNGEYFFTDGWKNFEQEMGSNAHKILMYKPVDSSKLKGKNKEKETKRSCKAHGTTRSRLNEIKDKSSSAEKRLSFCKEMKKYHRYGLNLPMDFSIVIGKATSGTIELMDQEGRMWPVQVLKDDQCNSFRLTINFLVGNKASVGSTVIFKSIPNRDKVIKVRVVDGENNRKELFLKKTRGRPSSCSKLSMRPWALQCVCSSHG